MCESPKGTIDVQKLLSLLGLASRARQVIFGTPQICEMLAKNKSNPKYPLLVIEASDTSDNTHKRIGDKCTFYGVKHVRIECDGATLAHALGKSASLAAVALTDENFCRLAEKQIF